MTLKRLDDNEDKVDDNERIEFYVSVEETSEGCHILEIPLAYEKELRKGDVCYVTLNVVEPKIKPCPCCGSNKILIWNDKTTDVEGPYVICRNCNMQTPQCSSEEEALAVWNNRPKSKRSVTYKNRRQS